MPADVKLFQENDWDIDFQGGDIAKTYTFRKVESSFVRTRR